MEEDIKLFQLVKKNPIKSCMDLSTYMRGKRNGVFYFTEDFRVDFENKMSELGRLKEENKQLRKENESYRDYLGEPPVYENAKYIPKSKVKEKIEELEKQYKIIEQSSDFIIADTIQPKIQVLRELLED